MKATSARVAGTGGGGAAAAEARAAVVRRRPRNDAGRRFMPTSFGLSRKEETIPPLAGVTRARSLAPRGRVEETSQGDRDKEARMARYVDGFVLPVAKKNLPAYRRLARKASKVWREYGALEYRECVGDDLKPKGAVPFPRLARCKPGETVVFAWIVYRSRADRDRINAKIMKDPRFEGMDPKTLPFDMKRITYGGFKVLVEA
jgi:uncharacterized protein YbaA (DUF1428 family)